MENISQYLVPLIILIIIAAVLTFLVFKRRALSKDGLQKGTAANPGQVRRENPPDPKHRSVNQHGA
ncbi:MAG: hypothetical protein ABW110_16610 [Steroidobacteraceae bacterium]